jgi:hypothetical protein
VESRRSALVRCPERETILLPMCAIFCWASLARSRSTSLGVGGATAVDDDKAASRVLHNCQSCCFARRATSTAANVERSTDPCGPLKQRRSRRYSLTRHGSRSVTRAAALTSLLLIRLSAPASAFRGHPFGFQSAGTVHASRRSSNRSDCWRTESAQTSRSALLSKKRMIIDAIRSISTGLGQPLPRLGGQNDGPPPDAPDT